MDRRRLLRESPLLNLVLVDPDLGKTSSGGMLSPKWRASFARRLRRLQASRFSLHLSRSEGEGRDKNDLEAEGEGEEKGDDCRFLNVNSDTAGLENGDNDVEEVWLSVSDS